MQSVILYNAKTSVALRIFAGSSMRTNTVPVQFGMESFFAHHERCTHDINALFATSLRFRRFARSTRSFGRPPRYSSAVPQRCARMRRASLWHNVHQLWHVCVQCNDYSRIGVYNLADISMHSATFFWLTRFHFHTVRRLLIF